MHSKMKYAIKILKQALKIEKCQNMRKYALKKFHFLNRYLCHEMKQIFAHLAYHTSIRPTRINMQMHTNT